MRKDIKLEKISDAIELVDVASKVKGNVWLSNDSGCKTDGKSILGVFAVAKNSAISVEYPDNADDFDDYLNRLILSSMPHNNMR